uniref:Uncharacterized protein n=1 Tax=Magallana gigas TaxID=29159 RepID=K1S661_MAGGI
MSGTHRLIPINVSEMAMLIAGNRTLNIILELRTSTNVECTIRLIPGAELEEEEEDHKLKLPRKASESPGKQKFPLDLLGNLSAIYMYLIYN